MRSATLTLRLALCVLVGAPLACKDAATAEAERHVATAGELVAEGRTELARGRYDKAIAAYKQAISEQPDDVSLYPQLAEAYQRSGNEAGAILTLKQAEAKGGKADPSLQRARADLYLKMHQPQNAITEFLALRDAELLTDGEILNLARLLAHSGRVQEGFDTLAIVQKRAPDDPEAKTAEAEILLAKGDDVGAGRLMDRLLAEQPTLTGARLLRASFFLKSGRADLAEKDLAFIGPEDSKRADVVTLKSKALRELDRTEEAAKILEPLVEENPKDADLLALLAETRLAQNKPADAQALVEKALSVQPKFARALYVRGRALEAQRDLGAATSDYEAALKSDPAFTEPLSRLWVLYEQRGDKGEAMVVLEKLLLLNEAKAGEKVALARFYADTGANVERGKRLIDEQLKKDPKNPEYQKIKQRLLKLSAREQGTGIIIMRHR